MGAWSVAIVAALAIQGLVSPVAGTAACAVLVLVLLGHDAIAAPEADARALALPALALVPLAGILVLALPVDQAPAALWPAIAMVPLLVAIHRAAQRLDLRRQEMGLVAGAWRVQLAIALAGIPVGFLAAVVLEPKPLAAPDGWPALVGAAIVVGVFAGAVEELLLRGLLQPLMVRATGARGIAWTAALSASLYGGSRSPAIIATAGMLALGFGVLRHSTGSIAGIAVAHALIVAGALLIWPAVLP